MKNVIHNFAARLALNMKFLAVRLLSISVRILPFRILLLNSLGVVTGFFSMLLGIGRWKAIIRFAHHTGSSLAPLKYVARYFIQQSKNGIWGNVFYEAPSLLDQYIDTKSVESVRHVLSSGKGAIVIGAHYGPLLQTYLLNRRHLPVKAFMARQFASELNSIDRLVLKPLRSGMVAFLTDPGVILVSQGDERRIIEHIKEGGVAVMYIDYPGPPGAGKTATFLGLPMHPHTTLFRLAIKYDIPVFFSFFNDVSDRGYRMNLVPSGDFSTPAEGYQRYADYLQTQIEECPFMWGFLPHFFEIFQVGTDGV